MGGTKIFTEDDQENLIKIVKFSQARNVRGSLGNWKEFLKATDKKVGSSVSDPAKRSWETLASFVQTFTAEDYLQITLQVRDGEGPGKKIESIESEWGVSPVQELVKLTRRHRRYQESYTFTSDHEGWVVTDLGKAGDSNGPEQLLSMDCEMVVCENGERELSRVCVVNSECKMVLDMLVKTAVQGRDDLIFTTGISEAVPKSAACHFIDAQRAVLNLLSPHTILVGHSLCSDLKVLRINHRNVIDTAFIFQYFNKPESYSAGLNELCKAVLGYEFRADGKPHNCLDDALIPMQIVLHILEQGLKGPINISTKKLDEWQFCKLLLHGIPNSISVDHLQEILPKSFPCEIAAISWSKHNSGTTYVVFGSSDEANKAFEELNGQLRKDYCGRPQKTVSIFVLSGLGHLEHVSFKVRKMSNDNDDHQDRGSELENFLKASYGSMKKAIFEIDDLPSKMPTKKSTDFLTIKKRKKLICVISEVEMECEECDCNHLQELENLRRKIRDQEVEIQALRRIIIEDLTRR